MISKQTAKKWAKALRSGEYKQGKYYLCEDGYYCCLGVLDELYDNRLNGLSDTRLWNHALVGMRASTCDFVHDNRTLSFSALNDYFDMTFDEIADVIEAVYLYEVLQ